MTSRNKKAGPVMRPGLLSLKPYQPGKALSEVRREWGIQNLAKLASNENPLGPSPKALRAARAVLAGSHRYPEGSGFDLRRALCKRWTLSGENFVLGNGSNELLILAAQAFGGPGSKVVYSEKSFVVYEQAAIQTGSKAVAVASRDFEHDLSALAQAARGAKVLYLCNPNNPTGSWHPPEKIEALLKKVSSKTLVVLDQAYAEYCGHSQAQDKKWLKRFPHLLICRTFSKVYGLAGLRIGYGIASKEIIAALERCRQPFNTNRPAQAAAAAALSDQAFVKKTLALNKRGIKAITLAFRQAGIWYKETKTNFIFFKEPDHLRDWNHFFLHQGLILRPMGGGYLRVTIGKDTENRRFLQALKKGLKHGV